MARGIYRFVCHIIKNPPAGALTCVLSLFFYFLFSFVFLNLEMKVAGGETAPWSPLDCVYFAVVVVSTVGYGDLLPASAAAKLYTTVYVLFGAAIAAMAILQVVNHIRVYIMTHPQFGEDNSLFPDKEHLQRRRRIDFAEKTLGVALFLLVGTVVNALMKDWGDDKDSRWINGLYYSVITLTTVGFGDIYPLTPTEKVWQIAVMIVGIPVFGACLAAFSALLFEEVQEELTLKLVRGGFSKEKLSRFERFTKELEEHGAGDGVGAGNDGVITRFEFLAFVLVENGIVQLKHITEAMRNFDELDTDKGGNITYQDLEDYVNDRQQRNGMTKFKRSVKTTKAAMALNSSVRVCDFFLLRAIRFLR
jgi:potassium channel subfamily K